MSTYIPAFKGYITDVPEMWFKRCDGEVFHFDELTQASVTPNTQFTEVNAGWSLYPVAYLPGQSTMEMQFTSGQFTADMFIMANNKAEGFVPSEEFTALPVTEYVVAQSVAGNTNLSKLVLADLPYEANTTKVRGFTVVDASGDTAPTSVETGELVLYTYTDQNTNKTVAELYAQIGEIAVGKTVDVTYEKQYAQGAIKEMLVDNRSTAMGEVICKWPVYGSSDVCTDSAIRGYVLMKIFKARVTAAPGFDTSLTYRFPLQ